MDIPPSPDNWIHHTSVEIVAALIGAGIFTSAGASISAWRRKYRFDTLLTGQWDGRLVCEEKLSNEEFKSHVIECALLMTYPESGQKAGFIHYCRKCTKTDQILVQGLDAFHNFKRQEGSEFKMDFTRVFHKQLRRKLDYSNAVYTLDCSLEGKHHPLKLQMKTKIPERGRQDIWSGILSKR